MITPVPTLSEQIHQGKVLVWFHSTDIESLKVYRWRIRLVLLNPLLTYETDVEDKADAKQFAVRTPFSDWSDPTYVPKATEFFVVSESSRMGTVSVAIFNRVIGMRVKKTATVSEGQSIGLTAKVKVIGPDDSESQRIPVDFSTGAIAVDFEYNKPFDAGGLGNKNKVTSEMIFLDEKGNLRIRLRALDTDSLRYKQLKSEAKQAKALVARAAAGGMGRR